MAGTGRVGLVPHTKPLERLSRTTCRTCIICGYHMSITFYLLETSENSPKTHVMGFVQYFVQNVDYLLLVPRSVAAVAFTETNVYA